MKKVLLITIGAIIFASCASNEIANSGDVKQDEIHQAYSIIYGEGGNETHVKATFRFGGENGTTLILTPPSSILFNDEAMTRYESDFVGAYYKEALEKPLANGQECKFVFTDTDKKTYTNAIKFNSVLVGGIPAEVSKGSPLEFTLITNPLGYGEKLTIKLRDTSNSVLFEVPNEKPKKQFLIPATVIKKLNGKVTMEVTRSYNMMLKEGTSESGTIRFEYRLKERVFYIK